jgi:mRNA-degrading endonuclease YafQ of YafQ-DinJ toxin-antitoxin module
MQPRKSERGKKFKKLLDKWIKSGQHTNHIKLLREIVIPAIINRKPIPPEFNDHPLTGQKWGQLQRMSFRWRCIIHL